MPCQELQKIEPLLSFAFVSHMCSRTALLMLSQWLFLSVPGAVCLKNDWGKEEKKHIASSQAQDIADHCNWAD